MWLYLARNKNNGKVYIGKTKKRDPVQRWRQHHHFAIVRNKRCRFYSAIRKYGFDAFEFSVLRSVTNEVCLNSGERIYIQLYRSTDPQYGYNMSAGGDGGAWFGKRSEEFCRKLSSSLKGKYKGVRRNPASEFKLGNKVNLGRNRPDNSERMRQYWASKTPEERRQHGINAQKQMTPEVIKRIAGKNRGRTFSPETIFHRGEHRSPATEFKKGERSNPSGEFKKGLVPWNKGTADLERRRVKKNEWKRFDRFRRNMQAVNGQSLLLQHCCGCYL